MPATLDVKGDVAIEPRYRGIFKVNGYVLKARLVAAWNDGTTLVPEAKHAGSRLHCDAPVMFVALGDSRGVRSAAMQIDGAVVPVLAGTAARGASARLPCRRRRVVRWREAAAQRRSRPRAGRHRRARVRAGRRQHTGRARVRLAASIVRRPLPADRAPGRRERLSGALAAQRAGDDRAAGRLAAARRHAACTTARSTTCRRPSDGRRGLRRDLRRRLHGSGQPLRAERPRDQVRPALHRPHLRRRRRGRGAAAPARPPDPVPARRLGDRGLLPAPGEPLRARPFAVAYLAAAAACTALLTLLRLVRPARQPRRRAVRRCHRGALRRALRAAAAGADRAPARLDHALRRPHRLMVATRRIDWYRLFDRMRAQGGAPAAQAATSGAAKPSPAPARGSSRPRRPPAISWKSGWRCSTSARCRCRRCGRRPSARRGRSARAGSSGAPTRRCTRPRSSRRAGGGRSLR